MGFSLFFREKESKKYTPDVGRSHENRTNRMNETVKYKLKN